MDAPVNAGQVAPPNSHAHLVDQMPRLLDQAQHPPEVPAPLVEQLVGALFRRKVDDARRPVNLGVHRLVRHELAQHLLGLVGREVEQVGQARHRDLRIVAGDDADVLR